MITTFSVIPMPVNAEGTGPEMNPQRVVRTEYEVWDELYLTYGSWNTKAEAQHWIDNMMHMQSVFGPFVNPDLY